MKMHGVHLEINIGVVLPLVKYKVISDIYFDPNILLWPEWKYFLIDYSCNATLIVKITFDQGFKYGLEILDNRLGKPVLKDEEDILCVNQDWTEAMIISPERKIRNTYKLLNALLLSHLSTRQTIEMHASLIQIAEKGIMFLGPSEIGKTTQAELWMQYRGAEIINGDMVFVKKEEDRFLGCGSPWHGSSPYCLNKQVPLSALIVLKQSKQNTIRRLTGFEMVSSVMSSVFWPTWYREGYEAACETFDTLLNTVPVYELSCRPDEDAVKLTEETIFGK